MAQQQVSLTSVPSSTSAVAAACRNWWEVHANGAGSSVPLSTWTGMNARWPQQIAGHHSSASDDQEDLSIDVNASNHAGGLSLDSSSAELSADPVENDLWSQVLLGVGSSEDIRLQSHHEHEENFLEVVTSRSLTKVILEPECDYLKRMDSNWEFTNNTSSVDSLKKLISSSPSNDYNGSVMELERVRTTDSSDLIGYCSQLELAPSACGVSLDDHSMAQYSTSSDISFHAKQETLPTSSAYPVCEMAGERSDDTSYAPCYDFNVMKTERHQQNMGTPMHPANLLSSPRSGCTSLQAGLGNLTPGVDDKCYAVGLEELLSSSIRSLSDLISFSDCMNKPEALMDVRSPMPRTKGIDSSCSKKQGHESSSTNRNWRAASGTTEGKKKRSENASETTFKKPKHEMSTASSIKLQAPKVKLGDKITPLQQLVSPFGKTDTASVLLETINCIKILQEQVQLLSDPYMKTSASKDHSSWAELQDRRERIDKLIKLDLKSKGLCLIPVSCIPPSHRENNCQDYWMPPYRSCLYR